MQRIVLLLLALPLAAQPRVTSVVHAADFGTTLAPGSLATIFGSGFAAAAESAGTVPLPSTLGGTSVSVGGRAAPLTYVSPTQVNFQVPVGVAGGSSSVTVTANGQTSPAVQTRIAATAPGVFQYGARRGVIQNQDYSLNEPANPAAAGTSVIVYFTGLGLTNPAVADGNPAPSSPLARTSAGTAAYVGGEPVQLAFIGLTPGSVGLAQANLIIPRVPVTGDYPLVIEAGAGRSASVQIAVQGDPRAGLPEAAACVSGTVERVVRSLEKEFQQMADEIVIGETRLCATCDNKLPLHAPFVNLIDRARRGRKAVDMCYDSFGTVNFLRVRR